MEKGDSATARITVRPDIVAANFAAMAQLAPDAATAAVVKADAYGLGLTALAPVLASAGAETFFVARLEEGIALRALLPRARIFVLDGVVDGTVPAFIAHHLIPVLGSLAEIAAWQATSRAQGAALEAAIHVDTGMNRLGLPEEELSLLAAEAAPRLQGLSLALIMSHLASSDDAADPLNARQLTRFRAALARLPSAPASLAASGGIMLGKPYHFDMVRPGIALYGGNPQPGRENPVALPVRFAGRVLQIRRIDKGESVGYAATFCAKRPSMIATVALGYADGVHRAAAMRGFAAMNGARAPFAGRVSMDIIGLDVTDIDGVAVGDEAELFGPAIGLDEAAEAWGTNAYELLTGLSRRVPRRYVTA